MLSFILSKILRVVTIVFGVSLIIFLLMHAIPGSPWNNYSDQPRMLANQNPITQSQLRELDRRFGLNLPIWRQYTRYIIGDMDENGEFFCGVLCGNLGPSISQRGRTVQDILFAPPEGKQLLDSRFGYSIRLVLLGSFIALGLGIPLGIWSGTQPRSAFSRMISFSLAALISIPNFVLGLLAIIVFASWLHLTKVLPDWDNPASWIIPAIVLAIMPMASIARVTHATMVNIINEDYIRTARGKGMAESRIRNVHMMRNALAPIITFTGPVLIEMFVGLLIIENLYSFPGFGREYWQAVLKMDYPLIMGVSLIYALAIIFINGLIGALCDILDPRIRSVRQQGASQ